MTTYFPAKQSSGVVLFVGLVDQAARPQFKAAPTLAAGDFKLSKDGAALANLVTLPTVVGTSKLVKVTILGTEMGTAANLSVLASDVAGAQWDDLIINIQTAANSMDDIKTDTAAILVDTGTTLDGRIPAALVSGRMDSNAAAISGATVTADRLEAWLNGFITGSAVGTPTATVIDTDLTEATDDHYNGMIMAFTGGTLLGQARRISDYNGTTKEITVQPAFTEAPVATDTFIIVTIIVGGLDANGRMDVGSVAGTAQTAGDLAAMITAVDNFVDTEVSTIITDVAAVKADTAAILTDTGTTLDGRIPAALVGGRMDSSVGAVAANAITASGIADGAIDAGAIASYAITAVKIGTDAITAAKIADGALDNASLAADLDTYQARVEVIDDDTGARDYYQVTWFKNGEPITSGITSPTIQVIDAANASNLIAQVAMTEIGALGLYKHTEGTGRMVSGEVYVAKVQASIASATRTWFQTVGRDD